MISMTKNSAITFIISLVVVFGASAINRFFRPGTWYQGLSKPIWNPPSWVFGVVWPLLYLSMAVALWLLWESQDHPIKRWALYAFFIQLLLNSLWSMLFFGMKQIGWAFLDILLLGIAILATLFLAWPVNRLSSYLLTPYFLWINFAAVLNFVIWRLNK